LVDVDPIRPKGISSTEGEHALAIDRMQAIQSALHDIGWPEPLCVDSGNGGQLIYAIELPANDDGLIRRVLAGLAFRFDDEAVKVDVGVFNPARICKVPGTLARKGDHTAERPHRRANILFAPKELTPVPISLLAGTSEWEPTATPTGAPGSETSSFDLTAWFLTNRVECGAKRPWTGGVVTSIRCPVDANHGMDAWVAQSSTGMLSAGCWHTSCSLRTWASLREHYRASHESPSRGLDGQAGSSSLSPNVVDGAVPSGDGTPSREQIDTPPILPEICWRPVFSDFRAAYSHCTEGSDAFLYGGLYVLAGLVLGRNARLAYGTPTWANAYVANVGATGRSRKSTAQGYARGLLPEIDDGIEHSPGIGSPEGLLGLLESGAGPPKRVLVDIGELATLLRKGAQDATRGLIPMLVDLFDCPQRARLPNRKNPIEVRNPFLSVLASTTPEWLRRDLQADDVRGGLAGRFLYMTGTEKPAIPLPPLPDQNALVHTKEQLIEARDRHADVRTYGFSPEAQEVFVGWYHEEHARSYESPILDAVAARLHLTAMKTALIHCALEDTGAVTADQIRAAIAFADYQRLAQAWVFSGYGDSRGLEVERRVVAALEKHGPLPGWRIRQLVRHNTDAHVIAQVLRNLAAIGEIEQRTEGKAKVWALLGGKE
jgi:hypothetical protein